MKKVFTTVVMVCFVFIAVAQPNKKRQQKPDFTDEQMTTLSVKKMTLALNLSASQQEKIRPLLLENITKKKEMMADHKANKEQNKTLSSDELYAKMVKKLDNKTAYQAKVRKILNEDQYENWKEIKSKMHKKRVKRKGPKKEGKNKKRKAQE